MLKRVLRQAITSTAGRLTARYSARRVVVLCYHSIHPRLAFASADPELFQRHLEWLGEHCDVVPLASVPTAANAAQNDSHVRPVVSITFDDGYEDNFTYAYPSLKSAGMDATFFVTVGLVEHDPEVLRRLTALRGVDESAVRAMNWDQVRRLIGEGFTVGSHTYSHPNLARLTRSQASNEIERARAILEDQLSTPVRQFAYPFGRPRLHVTDETAELVRNAGHDTAAAVLFRGVKPTDDRLLIPRFFVTNDDVATLEAKIVGRWDPMGLWQEHVQRGLLPFQLDSTGRAHS
jgi:peptidoglycan/xylan/chitin deacetylase (PgdA/CDA1 family)